jgi:hypothetical protein
MVDKRICGISMPGDPGPLNKSIGVAARVAPLSYEPVAPLSYESYVESWVAVKSPDVGLAMS